MKVYVSGGGTGGHFFPALALIECLTHKGLTSSFVGSERGIENKLKDLISVESLFLTSKPLMGKSLKEKIPALIKNLQSSLKLAKRLSKDGVGVIFGGYASLPLGVSCILRGLPLFVHEQNSVPSQTNRLLSKFAKRIFITFEYSRRFFPRDKVLKTGLPVRRRLLEGLSLQSQEARKELGLENRETLLVIGGSQGASFLNRLAVEVFSKTGWQGIHITGEREYQEISEAYRERNIKVLTLPFSHSMELVYRASTIALSRAGASTITELSLYGVPALFVPFPYAVHDHQYYNAKEIEELGGGFVLREKDASLERVISALEKMLHERESPLRMQDTPRGKLA
ncbi:MAG: undecaprenyldiphospho-muramoylpentapeptide beta-N-acetylglucosaminyltransferase [Aquificaceae bacterium]|nr:undecaprenyldiphospho-muramoylpentapeptide beta-N-acetylglucosaminyltransferase [Aquificaceae bacterium]